MAILASVASASYAPQTVTIPFVLTGSPTRIQITLNRAGWPAGLVAKAGVAWTNGNTGNAWVYGGPDGTLVQAMAVPVGATQGTVTVVVVQTVATSILVEAL